MKKFIYKMVEEHKFFRRSVLIWSMGLITYCTIQVFDKIGKLTAADAAVFSTVVGLLTITIGFYQWSRGNDHKGG